MNWKNQDYTHASTHAHSHTQIARTHKSEHAKVNTKTHCNLRMNWKNQDYTLTRTHESERRRIASCVCEDAWLHTHLHARTRTHTLAHTKVNDERHI